MMLTTRHRMREADRSRMGFSAVEISMVATIIMILTLIALPMFRNRIEDSRIKACQDEMSSISKAQDLVFAETGSYMRLNDLDNTTHYDPAQTMAYEDVPIAVWDRALTQAERAQLAKRWNGPYLSIRKFLYLDQLYQDYQMLGIFRDSGQAGGPILLIQSGALQDNITVGSMPPPADKYPLDPWGNPYLFFGKGPMVPGGPMPYGYDFKTAAIISLGPNGLPGDGVNVNQQSYLRYPIGQGPGGIAILGDGDDIIMEF